MPLRDILSSVVDNVDGALALVIMGFDGIPIDEVTRSSEQVDVQLLAVEYSTALKEVQRSVDVMKSGKMEEVTISTDTTCVIVHMINDDFFALLVISSDGNYGKGRYMLRLKKSEILKVLS